MIKVLFISACAIATLCSAFLYPVYADNAVKEQCIDERSQACIKKCEHSLDEHCAELCTEISTNECKDAGE